MSQPSIKKNFAYSTAYQILTVITPFITAPYVSRVLGPVGVGIQNYTGSVQAYFLLVAALGTVAYGSREIAQHRDNKEEYSKLFWEIELMTVITSSVVLLAWIGFIFLSSDYKLFYIALIPNIFGSMFDISWLFSGLEQFKFTVIRNTIFKILAIILMFIVVREPDDVLPFMWVMSFTTVLASLSLWTYVPKIVVKVKFKELSILRHFGQTMVYFVPSVATSIYLVLDRTLLGLITNDVSQNGYYAQAEKIITMAKSFCLSLNAVVGMRISYLFAKNKIDEIKSRIDNTMNYIFFVGVGSGCGIAGVAAIFVPTFFGDGFEPVTSLLYIFAPIITVIGISNCIGTHYYTPAGLRKQSNKYIIIGALVNLVMNLLLIPRFGAYGAAVSSLSAELVITVLYFHYCNGYMTRRKLYLFGWKKIVAGLIMLFVVHWLGVLLTYLMADLQIGGSIITLAIQGILGVAIYGSLLLLLRDEWTWRILREQVIVRVKKFI